MQLYHFPSTNPQKVTFAFKELGLDCELVPVDLSKGEQRQPAFLAHNPFGRVPVLVDDGLTLPESHAILAYLGEKAGRLWPVSAAGRAEALRWLFFLSQHIMPAAGEVACAFALRFSAGRSTPPRRILSNAARKHCRRRWRSLRIIWLAISGSWALSSASSIARIALCLTSSRSPASALPDFQGSRPISRRAVPVPPGPRPRGSLGCSQADLFRSLSRPGQPDQKWLLRGMKTGSRSRTAGVGFESGPCC